MLRFLRRNVYTLIVGAVVTAALAGALVITTIRPLGLPQLAVVSPAEQSPAGAVRISERQPAQPEAASGQSTPSAAAAGPRQPESPQAKAARMYSEVVSGQSDEPAVVVLGARWSAPSRKMLTIVGELEQRYSGKARFVYIDIDRHPGIASQYDAAQLPVQLLFDRDGKLVYRHAGFLPRLNLVQKLDAMGAVPDGQAKLPRPQRPLPDES